MTKDITLWQPIETEGECYDEEVTYQLPAKYEVCPRCEGKGTHDHPAFANGISQAEFDEDPDFFEDYMKGVYDVQCSECRGVRVVVVVDEDRLSDEQTTIYRAWCANEAAARRERASEIRFGY